MWHENDTNLPQDFKQRVFDDLSTIAGDLAYRYTKISEQFDVAQADKELNEIHQKFVIHDLNLCDSVAQLREQSKKIAAQCLEHRRQNQSLQYIYEKCELVSKKYRISPPEIKNNNLAPVINRLCCDRWWFSKIKTLRLQALDNLARSIELVHKHRSCYASDYVVKLKRQQKDQTRQYLSSTFITNENGESFSLQDLSDKSVSNPSIRRAELMVRIKGFEMVAQTAGHSGEFYTITTPSKMHSCLNHGKANPKYDGTTPAQAQEYLCHQWALIRSELNRQNIRPYGFRVVEPHHDGTPHWHLLLFMPPENTQKVRKVIKHYALAENGNEAGSDE